MPHHFRLGLNTNRDRKSLICTSQNVLKGLVGYPSPLIWFMTYSKTACRAIASQAAAGVTLYFRCFPANAKNNLAFTVLYVANN